MPLILDGDSFWLPFASAMVGGVAGSAILALVFAPAAFVLLSRLSAHKQKLAARLKASRMRHEALPGLVEQA